MKVTKEFVEPYLKHGKRHTAYAKTVDVADHLSFHFDGYVYKDVKEYGEKDNPYFTRLINTRRPSESDHINEYRRKIYLPITKQPCFKIVNSLKKIVKSPDWNINWSKSLKPAKIKEEEQLEVYCDQNLPIFNSVENWFYSYGLKEILTDPNGLICVLPTTYEVENDEYRKPYPYFINSEHVYDYVEGEYAVFRTNKSYEYKVGDITIKDFVVCVVTKEEIWEVMWTDGKNISMTLVLELNFKKMPAFRAGGVYKEIIDNSSVFESFVSPILPGLDAAAREISDLDAEVVQHIFTTMWYYATQGCASCNGTGSVLQAGKQSVCGKCEGTGVMTKSPYKDLIVGKPELGDQALKPPFAGYIEKNTDIVKIQDERIDNHIFKALASINMEFLAQVPLSESGKAKEVDRDELNNFVYGVAYHSVQNVINQIYKYINEIRVMALNLSDKDRREMLPKIQIPERFEILSENYLQEQLVNAKDKIDPIILNSMEIDFASKKFENNEDVKNKIITTKTFNPFPGLTSEKVESGVLAGIISKEDAIMYSYISSFIERAFNEIDGFGEKEYPEKLKVLKKYAKEKLKELTPATAIMDAIHGGLNPDGTPVDTPIDVEAEAKANLKGSVGGVQGIIQIQESVAAGITDYEAAVTLLFEIYGFDDATARKLLGSKEKLEQKKMAEDKLKQEQAKQKLNVKPGSSFKGA
jgi:hypothetical protein